MDALRQLTLEKELRKSIDNRINAVRHKNLDSVLSFYAPDVISFDVVDPLLFKGAQAVRKRLETWFATLEDAVIGYDLSDVQITINDDIAFCHHLNHVNAPLKAGGRLDMWWRETVCYRKIKGAWMITHAHDSVPFNTETGQASTGLKPDHI